MIVKYFPLLCNLLSHEVSTVLHSPYAICVSEAWVSEYVYVCSVVMELVIHRVHTRSGMWRAAGLRAH